ncbi:LysR family transcriptional regulator [Roseovarius sp.]|uniref:LysR family transcriptional regulator n=1 Tax=Roseovarius sp. TaxID=1486281 RepID=UPI0035637129
MKHLTTFMIIETIARTGSIRAAAEQAALTPSAVQRRLQGYEDELGYEIFERSSKGVRLNAAGEMVIQHVRETLAETDRLQSRIADLSGLRRGRVSIGCSQALVRYFLPVQIAAYQSEFPNVNFEVMVLAHGAAQQALEDYLVDLVLVFDDGALPEYKVLLEVQQRLAVIMAADHPLTRYDTLRLRQCFGYPVILPGQGFGGRALINEAILGKTYGQAPVLESNSFEYLKAHVARTDALTFQIEIGAPEETAAQDGLVSRLIDERDMKPGSLWLGQHRDRSLSVAVSRFAEQISRALSEQYLHF